MSKLSVNSRLVRPTRMVHLVGVGLLVLALAAWSFFKGPEAQNTGFVNAVSTVAEKANSKAASTHAASNTEGSADLASAAQQNDSGLPTIALSTLPKEGQSVYAKILRPNSVFPYDKDGSVFGNFERILPKQERGYYREYTVKTPGVTHRGARRIVCGGKVTHQPTACYYTDDHYDSFKFILTG